MKKHAAMKEKQLVDQESEEMETIEEESLDLKIMQNPNNKNLFVHSNEEIFHEDGFSPMWSKRQRVRWLLRVLLGISFQMAALLLDQRRIVGTKHSGES